MSNLALERYQNQSRIYEHTTVQQPSASQAEFSHHTDRNTVVVKKQIHLMYNEQTNAHLTVFIILFFIYCSDKERNYKKLSIKCAFVCSLHRVKNARCIG